VRGDRPDELFFLIMVALGAASPPSERDLPPHLDSRLNQRRWRQRARAGHAGSTRG